MQVNYEVKKELSQYSPTMRKVEISSLFFYIIFNLLILYKLSLYLNDRWLLLATSIVISYVLADFLSGFVHWFADTWGSVRWPIIGNTLIRSFREHHVDQTAITRHDFIETNGATALVTLPLILFSFFIDIGSILGFMFVTISVGLCFFSVLTNQFHKWSHQTQNIPFVAFLQEKKIILSKKHHAIHHSGKLDQHYCITNGWLNSILNQIQFFRFLEFIIHKTTGAVPRAEDIALTQRK